MVNYGVTQDQRRDAVKYIMTAAGLISVGIGQGISALLPMVAHRLPWVLTLAPPSTIAVYAALVFLVENYLWRWWPLRLYFKIPDLRGEWNGRIAPRKNLDSGQVESEIVVSATIVQSLHRMEIVLKNMQSSPPTVSRTISASVDNENEKHVVVSDIFRYDRARGTSELVLSVDDDGSATLSGDYISTYPRSGRLELKRTKEE